MPEYLAPGVFVEEISTGVRSIAGVDTSSAGFVGPTALGPAERPGVLTSLRDYELSYGGGTEIVFPDGVRVPHFMWFAARAFFENGGRRLHVARASREDGIPVVSDYANGLTELESVDVALVAAPGSTYRGTAAGISRLGGGTVAQALLDHAEARNRFALLDTPDGQSPAEVVTLRAVLESARGALFYPWVEVASPDGGTLWMPPSAFVAGVYARVDAGRGVHAPPANEVVHSAIAVQHALTDVESQALGARGVNCIRDFPGKGIRLWGARTLSSNPDWKYVNVRRLLAYLEASIEDGLQWAVFETNGEQLWANVTSAVVAFLVRSWRAGALAGATPDQAFFVRCDRTTMTQNDIDQGRLVCLVGVAPVRPAEFVIFRISQKTAESAQ